VVEDWEADDRDEEERSEDETSIGVLEAA